MDKKHDLELLKGVFEDKRMVPTSFDFWSLWLLCSACQMTVTHPGLGEDLRKKYVELGHDFQRYIAEYHPEVNHIMEAGWLRGHDVPAPVSPLAPTRQISARYMGGKKRGRGKPT
jgi:hypothetical protein